MIDMNEVIASNIRKHLNKMGKKQADLAKNLNLQRQTVHKMLNGSRIINAYELKTIADFCNTTMDELVCIPQEYQMSKAIMVCMGKVSSQTAKEGIKTAEKLMDLYLFHSRFQTEEGKKRCNEKWSDE
jgi:transcriptional regulator with XRE-family HTH domain